MDETTHARPTPTTPTAIAFCAWHGDVARGVRLIHVHEAGSGPGTAGNRFACSPCRAKYGLVPLTDRPL